MQNEYGCGHRRSRDLSDRLRDWKSLVDYLEFSGLYVLGLSLNQRMATLKAFNNIAQGKRA
jgi:hypothetical protein